MAVDDGEENEEEEEEEEAAVEEEEAAVEEEEVDEGEGVALQKITKADHVECQRRFVSLVLLANRGELRFQPVTKANYVKLAVESKSSFKPYMEFFVAPSDSDLGGLIKSYTAEVRKKRHHDGGCYKRDTEGGGLGCGCVASGIDFVKHVGFQDDQRELAKLFPEGGVARRLLLPKHRGKSAEQLARELALHLSTYRLACLAASGAARAANKRSRDDGRAGQASGAGGTPGPAAGGPRGAAAAGSGADPVTEDEQLRLTDVRAPRLPHPSPSPASPPPSRLRSPAPRGQALRTSSLDEVGRVFDLLRAYLPTVDESQRAQSKLAFDSMYKTLCAAYMSDSAPTSLSPVGVKAMQLLSILHNHKCAARTLRPPCAFPQPFPDAVGRGIAGKLAAEIKQKNRDKENTARQLHGEFEADAEAPAGL